MTYEQFTISLRADGGGYGGGQDGGYCDVFGCGYGSGCNNDRLAFTRNDKEYGNPYNYEFGDGLGYGGGYDGDGFGCGDDLFDDGTGESIWDSFFR